MLISRNRGHIFISSWEKLITPDWMSTPFLHFVGFFIFVPQLRLLSGSLEFDFLSRIVCAKNTCATAAKEIPKGELSFLTRNSKILFVSKAKNLIGFVWLKN